MPIFRDILRATLIVLVAMALLASACGGVRWARRGGTSARMMAGVMMLVLGMGVLVKPPQQAIEEAREDKGRKGGQSGDPAV